MGKAKIEEALENAKRPGSFNCPVCDEQLFSPLDKLSISMYGKCLNHTTEHQENNLLRLAKELNRNE